MRNGIASKTITQFPFANYKVQSTHLIDHGEGPELDGEIDILIMFKIIFYLN